MKELYGTLIIFFYFLKWPAVIGLSVLYYNGLEPNVFNIALLLVCVGLILQDFYLGIKKLMRK